MAISKKLEIIYHNGQPDGIRSIRRHLSNLIIHFVSGFSHQVFCQCNSIYTLIFTEIVYSKPTEKSNHEFIPSVFPARLSEAHSA